MVNEDDPDVEICVVTDSPLAREVTLIAQTQPKEEAAVQATSKITFMLSLHANNPPL